MKPMKIKEPPLTTISADGIKKKYRKSKKKVITLGQYLENRDYSKDALDIVEKADSLNIKVVDNVKDSLE
jgi:hypothetical protein